jgi:hypothetical protein
MEDVGILNGHLIHFTVVCCILWTFGIVRGNLVYFYRFGIFTKEYLATLVLCTSYLDRSTNSTLSLERNYNRN